MKKIIVFLITISIFLLFSCTKLEEEQILPENSMIPDQESFNTTMILTREGKKVAYVWAKHVLSFNKIHQTKLKDSISVDFFDRDGKHKSLLTAMEGIVYTTNNDMMALGNVIVTSDNGWVLKTERLRWKNYEQKVIADTNVVFITDKDTLYGDYFESDPDLKQYIIKNTRGVSHRKVKVE